MADLGPMRGPRLKKAALAIIANRIQANLKATERYETGEDFAVLSLSDDSRKRAAAIEKAATQEAERLFKAISILKTKTNLEFFLEMVRLAKTRSQELATQSEKLLTEGRDEEAACTQMAGFETRHISEQLSRLIPAVT
jgi:hypothetical protein